MKRFLAYCICLPVALLALISCVPETSLEDMPKGGSIDIRFSIADLKATKATTPGDGTANDGGGFADYYMRFVAPDTGTLSVWASSTDGTEKDDYKISVHEGGVISSQKGGYSSNTQVDFSDVDKGSVTIFPQNGPLKFYKIHFVYTVIGDNPATVAVESQYNVTLTWDFTDSAFQAKLGSLFPPQSLGSKSWNVTLDGLTIWSKGNSEWNASYFLWGGAFTDLEDLVILIANNDSGDIVATYPSSGRTGVVDGSLKEKTAVDAVLTFDLSTKAAGDYTVYAFGNTVGLWSMTYDDGVTELSGAQLTDLTTATQVENLKFVAQTRNTTGWEVAGHENDYDDGAVLQNGRIPVSAKAPLTVSANKNGEAYLELLRCVAKVTAIIINNTGDPMSLFDYKHTVHNINPNTGYVIPHDNDVTGTPGNLVANPCVKYNNANLAIPISTEGSQAYDWYVFPSEGPYTVCITFTLSKGDPAAKTYEYKELPITNWKAENIPALGRNQHLTVTTRISKGLTVSFNFKVTLWEEDTASVYFD